MDLVNEFVVASTIVGCFLVAVVSALIFLRKNINLFVGCLLALAAVLCIVPAIDAMLSAWKERTFKKLAEDFDKDSPNDPKVKDWKEKSVKKISEDQDYVANQRVAGLAAQTNSDLYDVAAAAAKKVHPPEFYQNRNITILVFYYRHDDVKLANDLKIKLLDLGYRASASLSDFAKWIPANRQNEVKIFAKKGRDAGALRKVIEGPLQGKNKKITTDGDSTSEIATGGEGKMIEGDFQIRFY